MKMIYSIIISYLISVMASYESDHMIMRDVAFTLAHRGLKYKKGQQEHYSFLNGDLLKKYGIFLPGINLILALLSYTHYQINKNNYIEQEIANGFCELLSIYEKKELRANDKERTALKINKGNRPIITPTETKFALKIGNEYFHEHQLMARIRIYLIDGYLYVEFTDSVNSNYGQTYLVDKYQIKNPLLSADQQEKTIYLENYDIYGAMEYFSEMLFIEQDKKQKQFKINYHESKN